MNKTIGFLSICLTVSLFFLFSACAEKNEKTIHISGSTTIEPFMKKVAARYKRPKETTITITAPGSIGGMNSLLDGSCDIVMSSSDLLPSYQLSAQNQGIKIKSFLLGVDLIVPIVNPKNRVRNLSLDQLKDIYGGKIQNWSELEGKNALIETVHRNNNSGTAAVWNRIIAPQIHPTGKTLVSNSSVLAYIAENENAIGYISHAFVNSEIKPLTVDGVDIGNKEIWHKNHPIKRPLFLYVDENKFTGSIKTFIIFTLMDKEVKKIFQASGFFSS